MKLPIILAATAASLVPVCRFGRPLPAFGEGDSGASGSPFVDIVKDVAGYEPPDFSGLDAKYGDGGANDAIPPAANPARGEGGPSGPSQPVGGETGATGASGPSSPALGDMGQTGPSGGQSGATGPSGGQTGASGATGVSAPTGATGPSGPSSPATGASGVSGPSGEFDPEAALKKLEAIQPKPSASQKTLDGFRDIKEITKAAIAKNKEYAAKIAELEKQPKGDPAVEKELAELREFRATFEAQNDPKIQEEFTKQLTAAEENVLKTLTSDEELMLPQAEADKLKAAGFDTPAGRAMINDMLNRVAKTGNHLLLDRVKDLFRGRFDIVKAHDAKMNELKTKAGSYWEARQQQEEQQRVEWAGKADQTLIKLFAQPGYEWGHWKEVKDGMDPAAKAAAEAHNTHLKDVIIPKIREGIQAVFHKDPERAMEFVAKSYAVDQALKDTQQARAELEKANQRIKELEETARGVQRISDPTQETSGPSTVVTTSGTDLNKSADEAADDFLTQKYGRR